MAKKHFKVGQTVELVNQISGHPNLTGVIRGIERCKDWGGEGKPKTFYLIETKYDGFLNYEEEDVLFVKK